MIKIIEVMKFTNEIKRSITDCNAKLMFIIISILLILSIFVSVCLGRYPINFVDLYNFIITDCSSNSVLSTIIIEVRLPRIVAALITGGVLAIAGTAYQGVFRNPMVSPDILGISSGAGFGASLAILLSLNIFFMQLFAFAFAIIAVLVAYLVSRTLGRNNDTILMLVLSGMMIS